MKTIGTAQFTPVIISQIEEYISFNHLDTTTSVPEDWELIVVFKEDRNRYKLTYTAPTGKVDTLIQATNILDAIEKSKKIDFFWVPDVLPPNRGSLIFLQPEFCGLEIHNVITNIVAYSFLTDGIKNFLENINYRKDAYYCDGKKYGTKEEVEKFRTHFLNLFKSDFQTNNLLNENAEK